MTDVRGQSPEVGIKLAAELADSHLWFLKAAIRISDDGEEI
jgi:hypothetical protein